MKEIDTGQNEQNVHSIFKGFTYISQKYKDNDYGVLIRNMVFFHKLNELYKNKDVFNGTDYYVYMSVRQIAKKWFNDCISPVKVSRMLNKVTDDGLLDKINGANNDNLQESWYKPSRKLLELIPDEFEKTVQEVMSYIQYKTNQSTITSNTTNKKQSLKNNNVASMLDNINKI